MRYLNRGMLRLTGFEGRTRDRDDSSREFEHHLRIDPNLVLGVFVQPQTEEVKQVVQIHRGEHVRVRVQREEAPRQLTWDAIFESLSILAKGSLRMIC